VVGGGWYFSPDWELFGRYEWSDRGSLSTAGNSDNINIISFGVNKYFAGHNAKWTTDLMWGNEEVDSGWGVLGAYPSNLTGFVADDTREDGQLVIRSQFQILF